MPDASGTQVLLSLARLNRIRAIDAANLTMTVEAGCVLQAVQEAAAAQGLLFPLSLAAEGSCTIGGNLATNAGGTQVLRYGNARELCLGLEVVTRARRGLGRPVGPAQGQHRLRPARPVHRQRGHAGRDHRRDAEALSRSRRRAMTALAACATLDAARGAAAAGTARASAPGLTGFEVMGELRARRWCASHFPQLAQPLAAGAPWTVLLEQSDSESDDARARAVRSACSRPRSSAA